MNTNRGNEIRWNVTGDVYERVRVKLTELDSSLPQRDHYLVLRSIRDCLGDVRFGVGNLTEHLLNDYLLEPRS
jgi:hypothetical protein